MCISLLSSYLQFSGFDICETMTELRVLICLLIVKILEPSFRIVQSPILCNLRLLITAAAAVVENLGCKFAVVVCLCECAREKTYVACCDEERKREREKEGRDERAGCVCVCV